MTTEHFSTDKPDTRSIERTVMDAEFYWGTGMFAGDHRRRRILGPAACAIASDELYTPLFEVSDDTKVDEALKPNSRYMRYVSDENGWDVQFFETDASGQVIETPAATV